MTNHILLATEPNAGEPAAEELTQSLIAGFYPLPDFLCVLVTTGAMLAQLYDRGEHGVEGQLDILKRTSQGLENADELIEKLYKGEYTAVTDENQIANLAMYAVTVRSYKGIARRGSLIRTFALFNKLCLQDPTTGKYYVQPDSLQGAFSVASTFRERANNIAFRYRRFIEWNDRRPDAAKVRDTFRLAKGMDYEQYAEAAAHLDQYFSKDFNVAGVRALPEAEIDDPIVREFLSRHSQTPQEMDAFLGQDPMKTLRDLGFHRILERPFLYMDGQYFLLHPRALENALGPGVFYAALPAGKQQDYFALVGQFFEEYMDEILQRIANTGGYVYNGELKYTRSSDKNTVDSNDHFLFKDGALFFFESRYARIPKELLVTLDASKIEEALQRVIFSKFQQLNDKITDYLVGDFNVPGVNRLNVRAIYPVVLLPHAFPRAQSVQARFDKEIVDRGHVQGVKSGIDVKPFEVVETEALEGLAGLQQPPELASVLERKFVNPDSRAGSFKNHLVLNEHLELRIWSDDEMRTWYRQLEQNREQRLRPASP